MNSPTSIYALITRATSKIGESFARILALEGYHLVLVDTQLDFLRSVSKTIQNEFPSIETVYIPKDLSQESAAEELYKELKEKNLNVELLINNEELEKPDHLAQSYIHDGADTKSKFLKHPLTILFLKDMMARNKGKILHFVSTINREFSVHFSQHNFEKPLVFSLIEIINHTIKESLIELNILNSQKYSIKFNSSDN